MNSAGLGPPLSRKVVYKAPPASQKPKPAPNRHNSSTQCLAPAGKLTDCQLKTKFHYAIQSQTMSPTFIFIFQDMCDFEITQRLACACRVHVAGRSKAGRKPAANRSATRFELYRHVEPVCDLISTQKCRELVADAHELVGNLVGNRVRDHVCDPDSVNGIWPLIYHIEP